MALALNGWGVFKGEGESIVSADLRGGGEKEVIPNDFFIAYITFGSMASDFLAVEINKCSDWFADFVAKEMSDFKT